MGSYSVILKPAVEKDLRALPRKCLHESFGARAWKTNRFHVQSLKLEGAEQLYRLRVGDYRIIYEVEHTIRQIIVHHVRHRREVSGYTACCINSKLTGRNYSKNIHLV